MSDARREERGAGREARGARLDAAIDGAVREMLDVEPRADLRARVMAQLPASAEATAGKPASGSRLPAFGSLGTFVASGFSRNRVVLAAAAALVVLAVFVARRSDPVPQAPVVAHGVDHYLPAAAAPVTPVASVPFQRDLRPAVVAAARPPRGTTPSASSVVATAYTGDGDATTTIDPLKAITPIGVTPIVQERIAPAEIAVRPLNAITEVQIAPLTPPDRRD